MALRAVSFLRTSCDIAKYYALPKRYLADSSKIDKPVFIPNRPMLKNIDDIGSYIIEENVKNEITVSTNEDVGLVSGVPEEHIKTRRVRIYCPAKSAMQSGTNNIHFWEIDFDTRERWENPLMGWVSTGDPMSNVKVQFTSEQEAIAHCEKMGWNYYVQKPNINNPKPRSYGTNFSWNKRTRVSTK